MRFLVIGGSWFLGYAIAEHACQRGHSVSLFNRGLSACPVPGVECLRGDRARRADLLLLAREGPWDAVIDVPGLIPAQVRDSAELLSGMTEHYVFVSSVSAYRRWPDVPVGDDAEVRDAHPDFDPGPWQWDEQLYGYMKAGSELAVARTYPADRRTILRPTIMLGPREYSARLTWWLQRVARGGSILAPGHPGRVMQPVDVRDVAAFAVLLLEQHRCGTYNVAAPAGSSSFGGMLAACHAVTGSDGEFAWVDEDWLAASGVAQWTEMPLWRRAPGTWNVDATSAASTGLSCRPLGETITDTWRWLAGGARPVPHERQLTNGLDHHKEQRILTAWRARAVRQHEGDTDGRESQPAGDRSRGGGAVSP